VTYADRIVLSQLFFVILVGIKRVQADVVVDEFRADLLNQLSTAFQGKRASKRTLLLKASLSSGVKESDLAMTGTTLTTSDSFFITIMSMGRREWPMKHQSNPRSPKVEWAYPWG